MKKLFTLIAAALFSVSMFAGALVQFHKATAATGFDYELLPVSGFCGFNTAGKWYIQKSFEDWVSYSRSDGSKIARAENDTVAEVARDTNKLPYDFLSATDAGKSQVYIPCGVDFANGFSFQWNSWYNGLNTDYSHTSYIDMKLEASGNKKLTLFVTGVAEVEATIAGCGSKPGAFKMAAIWNGTDTSYVVSKNTNLVKKGTAFEVDTLKGLDPAKCYALEFSATADGIALMGIKLGVKKDSKFTAPSTAWPEDKLVYSYFTIDKTKVKATNNDEIEVKMDLAANTQKEGDYMVAVSTNMNNWEANSTQHVFFNNVTKGNSQTQTFRLSANKLKLGKDTVAIKYQIFYKVPGTTTYLASDSMAVDTIKGLVVSKGSHELSTLINDAVKAKKTSLTLDPSNTDYTLTQIADAGREVFTIAGKGAKITASGAGQIQAKAGLSIDSVEIDASTATIAPLALASDVNMKADEDTAAFYSVLIPRITKTTTWVMDTQAKADTYNTYYADSIAAGKLRAAVVGETRQMTLLPGKDFAKYLGSSKKVFESQLISLKNSNVNTAAALFDGSMAPWSIRKFVIDNCQINKTGKFNLIQMTTSGVSIQNLGISNSTVIDAREQENFLLYGTNEQPDNVWGTDEKANVKLENNTLINQKYIANQVKNTNKINLTLSKNIFSDYNQVRNGIGQWKPNDKIAELNVVTTTGDASYGTVVSPSDLKVFYHADVEGDYHLTPSNRCYAAKIMAGDPRWLTKTIYADVNAVNYLKLYVLKAQELIDAATPTMKSAYPAEYTTLCLEMKAGDDIVKAYTDKDEDYWAATKQTPVLIAAIDAWMKASGATGISTVNAEDATVTGPAYNLAGQRVNASAKGLIIRNGKKFMNK